MKYVHYAVVVFAWLGCGGPAWGVSPVDLENGDDVATKIAIPTLCTDNGTVNAAFRIAVGDLMGNVSPFKDGLLEKPAPVILAGLDYNTPWTRDASINAWNGASLIMPDVARNTLLSVLVRSGGKVRIGGQYWDAIVWTTGAWQHYLYTGDREFVALALEVTRNSLDYFEQTEFDAADNLFRGPGWSDGVAAYPDEYADAGGSSGIVDWPKHNPSKVSKPGYGIPMKALSTNCLYYNAYVIAEKMAVELKAPVDPQWKTKAAKLKDAINAHLWNGEKGNYRFLVGPFGKCDLQEGLGSSYALLFGIADAKRSEAVFVNQHVTPAAPLRADAFEIADQQHAKVDARRNRRAADVVMVIRPADLLDRAVEVGFSQQPIELAIKHVPFRLRQAGGGHPHLLLFVASLSQRHRRCLLRFYDGPTIFLFRNFFNSRSLTFSTGC